MHTTVDYAQLWNEERHILAAKAAMVPDNGTIVEIGTAQGGSAHIFHTSAGHRGVTIYSVDIAPSPEAYQHLRETTVTILPKPSTEAALMWKDTVDRPIDLLFIDGSHSLQHVFEDFNSWARFLTPGGTIMFHDYDSVERGGLIHLGLRIVVDTILRCRLLEQPIHEYRLLHGTTSRSRSHPRRLTLNDCHRTWVELAQRLLHVRDTDYSDWTLVGDPRFGQLLRGCLNTNGSAATISVEEATNPDAHYLVCARPLVEALDQLRGRGCLKNSDVVLDSLQASYILAHALQRNRDYLLTLTSSRKEFFRWEELLFMYEHAFGPSHFPHAISNGPTPSSVARLSQVVAREQVRLSILSHLLRTFVDGPV